jgi:histidine triad (HIT) family protein
MDCLFCKIIKGELPSYKVYEDENFLAFLDITPINKGHVLLVPKEHHEDLFDMPDSITAKIFPIVKRVSNAVMKATDADGLNLGQNNKPAAGQAVMHFHLHIMPRFEDDGLRLWPGKKVEEKELKEVVEKIKKEI